LKLALEGRLADGAVDWNNPDVKETLSLCLSCKACRSECPSNVDVGKLKAEYTAQGFAAGPGPSLGTRMLANLGQLARRASRLHPLPSWALAVPGIEALIKACAGIAPSRSLPRPVGGFTRGLHGENGPVVILFADCFVSAFEPWIADSARTLLGRLGYRVLIPEEDVCCGRTAVSAGVLDVAREQVERSAGVLSRAIDAHDAIAVIVLEPSCLSAIKEEWRELRSALDPQHAQRLAEASCSIERFLVQRAGQHPRTVGYTGSTTRHIIHPHCHAKVEGPVLQEALGLMGIEQVSVLDSGCCGMAGAFGYMKETEELSRTIARQSLQVCLEDADDALVLAPGTSCRHQIMDCFGRRAYHPAEIAARALSPESVPS